MSEKTLKSENKAKPVIDAKEREKKLVIDITKGILHWYKDAKPWIKKGSLLFSIFLAWVIGTTFLVFVGISKYGGTSIDAKKIDDLIAKTNTLNEKIKSTSDEVSRIQQSITSQNDVLSYIQYDIADHSSELRRLSKSVGDLHVNSQGSGSKSLKHKWNKILTKVYVVELSDNKSDLIFEKLSNLGFDVELQPLFSINVKTSPPSQVEANVYSDQSLGIGLSEHVSPKEACQLIDVARNVYTKISFIVSGRCAIGERDSYTNVIGVPEHFQKDTGSSSLTDEDFKKICPANRVLAPMLFQRYLEEYSPSFVNRSCGGEN